MKVYTCDTFEFPLPRRHRFPVRKYRLLRQRLLQSGVVSAEELLLPDPVTDTQLLYAHDPDYLERVEAGRLSPQEIRRIGLPWSSELVRRARYCTGGTVDACRAALQDGAAAHLAVGTHHAFRDHGQGFCLFNDCIIAARTMQMEERIRRAAILDCDVHQGNGTAAIATGDPTLFTFSIHNEQNFPLHKVPSDLDIGLNDGTGDAEYLAALEWGIPEALQRAQADLVIYLAGADLYEGDLLGRFAMTKAGLARRDRFVFDCCRQAGLPVAITIAGGYARHVEDAIDIHVQTIRIAQEQLGDQSQDPCRGTSSLPSASA